mgnify:CR=1 FL=1
MSRRALAFVLGVLAAVPGTRAASSEWRDAKGATFRGEPVETAGPYALFRTGGFSSRFVPLRALSPGDCARFFEAVRHRPARARGSCQDPGRTEIGRAHV